MRVAITANRNLTRADEVVIHETMMSLAFDVQPGEIIFGGARGGDTVALLAVRKRFRGHGTHAVHRARLVVIVPDTIAAQTSEAQWAIRECADEVIELRSRITRDDGWAAYHRRNEAMVDRATHVVGFWNGDHRSGTWSCIAYARRMGRPVWVVPIVGADR